MTPRISLEEDLELKRFAIKPQDEKPRFNWGEVLNGAADGDSGFQSPEIKIEIMGREKEFDLAEVADTIGTALTDLMLSRQENDIFNEKNRALVAAVAKEVGRALADKIKTGGALRLSRNDVYLLIEKVLIDFNAHDVAKSLVIKRALENEAGGGGGGSEEDDVWSEVPKVKLIRRNGLVVPWNVDKIEIAVRKAFLSLQMDSEPAVKVSKTVTERVHRSGHAYVNIEEVQDMVQEELMRQGHFKAAEAYILYRARRAALRDDDESADSNQESMIVIKKIDGETFFWDGVDLRKRIDYAMIGLDLCLTREEIEQELRRSIHAETTEEELRKLIILNAKSLTERDADFGLFAGRLLQTYVYEEVLGWDIVEDGVERLREVHRREFKRYIEHGIAIKRLSPVLREFDIERLAEALDPSADLEFDFLGTQTLYDRYLIIDKTAKKPRRIETPQFFWMRVAMGLFQREEGDKEDWVIQLYNLYKGRRFCSSTPTLFNSGTPHSQLSSCYLYKVDDSIESIMQRGVAENAYLSKWAGGLGGSWTAVRGTGSYIQGTNGESQGVIPFLKLHNDQLVAVNQGGKRRGSGCAYLETWHNDISDFLKLRRNTGDDRRRTHDMNTANWIPDLFMKRMESREDWTLLRANEAPDLHELYGRKFEERYQEYERLVDEGKMWGKRVKALDLWKNMLEMLFETGHPWITFKDPCNIRSPQDHAGVVHSSNLCTEITLNTGPDETAVCNLGSVVLDTHIRENGELDLEKLRETVRVAVRALDNVIDINFYPTEAAKRSNMNHRPVGLGVMGLQNSLYKKRVSFASEEAVEFNDEFMEAIAYFAYEASSDLADERGTYESYKGSKWDRGILPPDSLDLLEQERGQKIEVPRTARMDWAPLRGKIAKQGMRNSNVLAIAPTATISNIMGTSPCIEPPYKNIYTKSNLSGEFVVLNRELVTTLKQHNLWTQELQEQVKYFDGDLQNIDAIPEELKLRYLTAFDIDFNWFIDAAARRQKWIDQSQSVNLFLPKPDMKTLSHMYRAAWRKGLKTTYYLRTMGATNIEKATVSIKKETRGVVAQAQSQDQQYSAEEKRACSIEAMRNGEECEACQ